MLPPIFHPHSWILFILLSLVFLLLGLALKGYLRKQALTLFLRRFLLTVVVLGLSILIMAQSELYRHRFSSPANISHLLLTPLLKLGLFLQERLAIYLPRITETARLAQQWANNQHNNALLILAIVLAVSILFSILLRRRKNPFSLLPFFLSLTFGAAAITCSRGNLMAPALRFGAAALICTVIYALISRESDPASSLPRGTAACLIGFIVIMALSLRAYQLYTISARFDNWEAVYGQQAVRLLAGHHPRTFWSDTAWRGLGHTGHFSPIYIYFIGLFFKLLGPNLVSLRLVSSVCGVLTIYFSYLLFRLLFNNTLALLTAAGMTFSPILINFNRTSNLVSITVMTGVLILWLLFRAIKKRDFLSYFFLGIVFSFMGYLYEPIMIFFPLACIFFLVYIFFRKGFLRRHWAGLILTALAIILVMECLHIPVWGRMFPKLFVRESVWHRTKDHHYTLEPDYIRALPLIVENIQKLFFSFIRDGKFNYDIWPRGNLYFNPLLSAFLIWGFVYSLFKLNKANFRIVVFLALFFFPPNILSRPPVIVRRLLFMFPLLYFFSALPLYRFWEELNRLFPRRGRIITPFLILGMIAVVGSYNSSIYFHCRTPAGRWESERFFDEYVKKHIPEYFVYVVPLKENSKTTIDFLLWEKVREKKGQNLYAYLSPHQLKQLQPQDLPEGNIAFICSSGRIRKGDLEGLKNRLREGRVEEYRDTFGRINAFALLLKRGPG